MSTTPKAAPALDDVLRAVAAGHTTPDTITTHTGRTRTAVNHATARLRARGLLAGSVAAGGFRLTKAGLRGLEDTTATHVKAGRRPTTMHVVLALLARGVETIDELVALSGIEKSAVTSCGRSLVRTGRATRTADSRLLLTDAGRDVLAEYTSLWGRPSEIPTDDVITWTLEELRAVARDAQRRREEARAEREARRAALTREAREERESLRAERKAATARAAAERKAARTAERERIREERKAARAAERERARAERHGRPKARRKPAPAPKPPVRLGRVTTHRRPLPTEGWVA